MRTRCPSRLPGEQFPEESSTEKQGRFKGLRASEGDHLQHEPLLQWGALRLPLTLVLLAGDSAGGSMLGGQEVTTEGPPTWPSGPFPPSSLAQPHPQLLPLSGPCDLDLSLSHTRRVRNKLLPSSWQAVLGLLGHLNPSRKFLWVSEWAAYRPSPGLRSLEAPPPPPPPHCSLAHPAASLL